MLARCEQGWTRLGAAYHGPGEATSGWRWLEARARPAVDYFDHAVPADGPPGAHRILLRPHGVRYGRLPPPDIFAVGLDVL